MNKQFEVKKTEILGMVDYLKKSNLEYKDKIREFENKVLDLTQQCHNALTVKVRLEVSSMKLENMLSSQKNGNNKEGHGYSHVNDKSLSRTPIRNQVSIVLAHQNLKLSLVELLTSQK